MNDQSDRYVSCGENSEILNSYITVGEFEDFIKKQDENQLTFPLSYYEKIFEERGAPVAGVHLFDAEKFCESLDDEYKDYKYKIPGYKQVNENPIENSKIGCWCHDNEGPTISGLSREVQTELSRQISMFIEDDKNVRNISEFAKTAHISYKISCPFLIVLFTASLALVIPRFLLGVLKLLSSLLYFFELPMNAVFNSTYAINWVHISFSLLLILLVFNSVENIIALRKGSKSKYWAEALAFVSSSSYLILLTNCVWFIVVALVLCTVTGYLSGVVFFALSLGIVSCALFKPLSSVVAFLVYLFVECSLITTFLMLTLKIIQMTLASHILGELVGNSFAAISSVSWIISILTIYFILLPKFRHLYVVFLSALLESRYQIHDESNTSLSKTIMTSYAPYEFIYALTMIGRGDYYTFDNFSCAALGYQENNNSDGVIKNNLAACGVLWTAVSYVHLSEEIAVQTIIQQLEEHKENTFVALASYYLRRVNDYICNLNQVHEKENLEKESPISSSNLSFTKPIIDLYLFVRAEFIRKIFFWVGGIDLSPSSPMTAPLIAEEDLALPLIAPKAKRFLLNFLDGNTFSHASDRFYFGVYNDSQLTNKCAEKGLSYIQQFVASSLLTERVDKKFPTWEGIRILRERKSPEPDILPF